MWNCWKPWRLTLVSTAVAPQCWELPTQDVSCECNIPFVHVDFLPFVLCTRVFSVNIPDSGSHLSLSRWPALSAMLRKCHHINKLSDLLEIRYIQKYFQSLILENRIKSMWKSTQEHESFSVITIQMNHTCIIWTSGTVQLIFTSSWQTKLFLHLAHIIHTLAGDSTTTL